MITTPSPELIVERLRRDLREVVAQEATSPRSQATLRLADELLAGYAATLATDENA